MKLLCIELVGPHVQQIDIQRVGLELVERFSDRVHNQLSVVPERSTADFS
jgi:hypothetical protein